MNEKRSHTLNTLGVPPSPQTGGQWAGRGEREIKEGDNRGEGMVDADRAEERRRGERENGRKRKRGGPRQWPHRAGGTRGLREGLYSVIAH